MIDNKKNNLEVKCRIIFLLLSIFLSGCEKNLDVDFPKSQLIGNTVFLELNTARAALSQIYADIRDNQPFTGKEHGLNVLLGLYADELLYHQSFQGDTDAFYKHNVNSSNFLVEGFWDKSYQIIYKCNAAIEGLQESPLDENEKNPLIGEALFLRAFSHFYLTNLFGNIPYIKTTNYEENARVQRQPLNMVFENIIADLQNAKEYLLESDASGQNIYAAKGASDLLLARVFLYNENWQKAKEHADYVLNNYSYYWSEDLNQVFNSADSGIILQLQPPPGQTTSEARVFIFEEGPPPSVSLHPSVIDDFEEDDLRLVYWVGRVKNGNQSWYFPFKYKTRFQGEGPEEYSVLMRLAEAYLIRAEANVMLNNLAEAQQDLNKIRRRAGLKPITSSSKLDLIDAVMKERKLELFTEFGHRWFDLKRTNTAKSILQPLKIGWKDTDILFPVPENEMILNANLKPQNPGY